MMAVLTLVVLAISVQKPINLIGFIPIGFVILVWTLPKIKRRRFKPIPEQQITATVFEKGQKKSWWEGYFYITFLFSEEITKTISYVPLKLYRTILKGDTGVLTFKERNNEAVFIAFENQKNK